MKTIMTIHSRSMMIGATFFSMLWLSCSNGPAVVQQQSDTTTTTEPVDKTEVTEEIPMEHYGIDISKWNGKEVTELAPSDSLTFVICKATQGLNSVDPDFKTNLSTIKQKGLISGAYHFYQVDDDPVAQSNHFWNTIANQGNVHIAPIVDIEQGSLPKGAVDTKKLQDDLLLFLNNLEQKCGKIPMIYTGAAFGEQYLGNSVFAKYPLWLAEYNSKPRIPKTWTNTGYKIWQRSESHLIEHAKTDFDLYFGKKSDLTK